MKDTGLTLKTTMNIFFLWRYTWGLLNPQQVDEVEWLASCPGCFIASKEDPEGLGGPKILSGLGWELKRKVCTCAGNGPQLFQSFSPFIPPALIELLSKHCEHILLLHCYRTVHTFSSLFINPFIASPPEPTYVRNVIFFNENCKL
jgi:hypothetical protein